MVTLGDVCDTYTLTPRIYVNNEFLEATIGSDLIYTYNNDIHIWEQPKSFSKQYKKHITGKGSNFIHAYQIQHIEQTTWREGIGIQLKHNRIHLYHKFEDNIGKTNNTYTPYVRLDVKGVKERGRYETAMHGYPVLEKQIPQNICRELQKRALF